MNLLLFKTQKYCGTLLNKNGMSQFLLDSVFPEIDVKSVMTVDGFPGNGSTVSVVNFA